MRMKGFTPNEDVQEKKDSLRLFQSLIPLLVKQQLVVVVV